VRRRESRPHIDLSALALAKHLDGGTARPDGAHERGQITRSHASGWFAIQSALLEESVPQGPGDGFRPRVHVQFLVDRSQMKADGVYADAEFGGGRLVLVPLGQEPQDAQLLRGEPGIGSGTHPVMRSSARLLWRVPSIRQLMARQGTTFVHLGNDSPGVSVAR
jgi:hypothetical protein